MRSSVLGMDANRNMFKKKNPKTKTKQTNKCRTDTETLREMNNVIPSTVYKSRS